MTPGPVTPLEPGWYAPSFGTPVPAARLLFHGDLDPASPPHVDITLLGVSERVAADERDGV